MPVQMVDENGILKRRKLSLDIESGKSLNFSTGFFVQWLLYLRLYRLGRIIFIISSLFLENEK